MNSLLHFIARAGIRCLPATAVAFVFAGCSPAVVPTISPNAPPSASEAPTRATSTSSATVPPIVTAAPTVSLPVGVFDGELALSTVAYTIPLSIRHVTSDQASIFFELNRPVDGAVYLVPQGSNAQPRQARLTPTEVGHRLTFEDLQPGTSYRVVVSLEGDQSQLLQPNFMGRVWGPVILSTQAEEGPIRFAAISDASFGDSTTATLIQGISSAGVDFVLHGGDVVDETDQGADPYDAYAEKFYNLFEPILRNVPIYTVPGNHDYDLDIRLEGRPFYYQAFPAFPDPDFPDQGSTEGNQYYGFVARSVQFLMLDSQVLFGVPGREAETEWLKQRLSRADYQATVVVVHVAPFSSSSVHPGDSLPVRSQWVPLFEQAHVALVISGHFHDYERLAVNGIPYLVVGGGSSTLYAAGDILPQSQVFRRQSHFVLGEIDGDALTLTAIGLDGQAIDQLKIPLVK